jgi:2,3-bisphosphoglycerate-dependent phosphoglycerate mutase
MPALSHLWLVRHGQSAGNLARDATELSGAAMIEIEGRDMDVPLSALGEQQARALGTWFRQQPVSPTLILSSPYARAAQTGALIGQASSTPMVIDERLREKEFGRLNRLTRAGILAKFPEEAEDRRKVGKFYYRPPGGESWCDVLLRVRSVIDHIRMSYANERVLIVAHQVIVLCARYVLERLEERTLLEIDAAGDVANCGLTTYLGDAAGTLTLATYNFVAPLEATDTPVTVAPDPGTRA